MGLLVELVRGSLIISVKTKLNMDFALLFPMTISVDNHFRHVSGYPLLVLPQPFGVKWAQT